MSSARHRGQRYQITIVNLYSVLVKNTLVYIDPTMGVLFAPPPCDMHVLFLIFSDNLDTLVVELHTYMQEFYMAHFINDRSVGTARG